MRNIQESILSMLREHSTRKHLAAVVCMIAIATAFAVFWSLRISGITLTSDDPICGMQEHTHTDACYDWVATVTDGTEEIESTDETEVTEAVEITDETETVETVEITGTTETEEATDEASAEESAEAYESASVEEDTSTAVGTEAEAVTGETETGTESVTEMSTEEDTTEEMTEELTEEETEAPQPGDTKVVDAVTYVYELVCGLEEHVHTDECYESDASKDMESENADETDEDDETDEISLSDLNAGIAALSIDNDYGISVASDESEIATIADEGNEEDDTTDTNESETESYYFADNIKLSEASDEDYIVYTIGDDGSYYLVKSNGSLYSCTDVSSSSDKATESSSDGAYYWGTNSSGLDSFKLTSLSSITLEDYLWTLTSQGTTDTDGNSGYTLYNSASGNYLAPGADESGTVLSGSAWWTATSGYSNWSSNYTISEGKALIFTIYCSEQSGTTGLYSLLLSNGTNVIRTHSYGAGDVDPSDNESSTTYGSETLTYNTLSSEFNAEAGKTYTVIVERSADESNGNSIVCDYTITYYDADGNAFLTFKATDTPLTGNGVYANFVAQYGTYNVSVSYATKVDKDDSVRNIAGSYDSVTVNTYNETTATWTALDETQKTGDETLSGDFDVTYGFNNSNTSRYSSLTGEMYDKDWNFVFVMKMGDDTTAYFYASSGMTTNTISSTLADISCTNNYTAYYSINNNWRIYMAQGAYCTLRVVREGNTITITAKMVHNSTGYTISECVTTISSDSLGDCDIEMYLTALGSTCTLSNVTLTDNTPDYDVYDYGAYSAVTTSEETIYLSASNDSGWTVYTDAFTSEPYLTSDSDNATVSWTDSSTGTTYYLAKLRQALVYFDGTNGGGTVYREGSYYTVTNDHHVDVTSYSMNSDGTAFYIEVPELDYTPYWDKNYNYYYDYELVGWYDIYNSNSSSDATSLSGISSIVQENYYKPGGTMELAYDSSSTGATITVCYADYIGTTYDAAIDSSTGNAYTDGLMKDRADSSDGTGGVNTDSFITTYVYDYSDIFNLYSAYLSDGTTKTSTGHTEYWTLGSIESNDNLLSLGNSIFGNGLSYGFIFFNNAATQNTSLFYLNRSTNYKYFNGGDTYIRIADITSTLSDLDVDLRAILFPDNEDYGYAWNTISTNNKEVTNTVNENGTLGTTYVGTGNYLYQYDDETGYYYYDAAKNAAFYSVSDERFYLYDYTVRMYKSGSSATSTSDFLPFNYAAASYTGTDEDGETYTYGQVDYTQINYAFGMKSEINFTLPDNVPYKDETVTSEVNQAFGRDMKFCFIGDDDLWVYIDEGTENEQLLLDIGGIHGEIYGEIDFSTGIVGVVEYLSETLHISDTGSITCENSSHTYQMTAEEMETYSEYLGKDTEGVYIFIEKTDEGLYEITDLAKATGWAYTETYIASDSASAISSGDHTLSIFYMERGASESNLAEYFNLSPTYDLTLLKADYTVASGLSDDATIETLTSTKDAMLSDAVFMIYEASSISGFSESGYDTLKEYLAYLSTTSSGTVVGTYYTNDSDNVTENGTTADGYNYEVIVSNLRQEHTYYIVETEAPAGYPLSGKVVELYMDSNGDVTIRVYSSGRSVLETYSYDYSAKTLSGTTSLGTSFVFSSGIIVTLDDDADLITLALAILNAYEYELPDTGSMGIFPYRRAGTVLVLVSITGLLITAFYHLVWVRKLRTSVSNKGYTEEKRKRGNHFARTRDHPRERSRAHGRDAPAAFADSEMKRSRGTGPGTE